MSKLTTFDPIFQLNHSALYNIEQKWYDVSQFDGKCLDRDGNAVTKGRKTIGLFRNKRLCFFVCIEQKRTPSLRGCEFDEKENRCYIYEGDFVLGKNKATMELVSLVLSYKHGLKRMELVCQRGIRS